MKDLGLMAVGVAIFSAIVFGVVTAGAESSHGSNTDNGVTQPPLPDTIMADPNRLPAPNHR